MLCLGWVGLGWEYMEFGCVVNCPTTVTLFSFIFLSFLGDHLPRTLSSTKRYSAFSFLLFLYRYFTEYLFFTSNIPFPLLPQYPFYPFNSWNIYSSAKNKTQKFFFFLFNSASAYKKVVKIIRRKEFKYSRVLR